MHILVKMSELILILSTFILIFVRSLYSLYRLQGYDYYAVFKLKPFVVDCVLAITIGTVALTTEYLLAVGYLAFGLLALLFTAFFGCGYYYKRTKFKFTARGLRISLPFFFLCLALILALSLAFKGIYRLISLSVLLLLREFILFGVNGVIAPFERKRNYRYAYNRTQPIRKENLIKIVITGSYGKTTCKNILTAILSKEYKVIATERNYNTPLGLVKSVENIPPAGFSECEKPVTFIAEAGARRVGDVGKICSLVTPTYGIVTGVCAQHLDTFRNVERIKKAKQELADYIGKNGTVVFNGDNEYTLKMSEEFAGKGVVVGIKNGEIKLKNLKISILGSSFDLCYSGGVIPIKTSLLGRHNALNIALSIALALEIGVSEESVMKAIGELEPVEHRLELINSGGISILDDSYNANEVGVMEALGLIATYSGRKVIYAQGVVECGNKKRIINRKIGREMGKIANVIILSGENTSHLKRGIKESGYAGKIYEFSNITHAEREFKNILRQGDILYIQNDIP